MTSIVAGEKRTEKREKEIFGAEFLAQPFSSGFPSMVKVLVAVVAATVVVVATEAAGYWFPAATVVVLWAANDYF